ncbi:MAG: 8-hydroxy-5-deazaflavin:NADPH oxidoreductase [Solirubrobacteraceae bacterium]|jgi:NADPH-dependent F420 reductase|nr:8-hydroxy-5-deazaflavin:NADPH oxidoreductase [Solirubrobacteraceae bacterium]
MSSEAADPVAIIGASGALGFGLAVRLARAGVPVLIGSRDPDRAAEAVQRALAVVPDGAFTACENAEAARGADTIVLSVPFRNHSETLTNLKDALAPGKLVIDATVPLAAAVSGKATRMLGVWQGSAAQQTAEMVPDGVRIVSALHTVSAASLTDLEHPLEQDVLVCGDSREDKRAAARMIERIAGLRCVDCGRLEMSRITESLTALLIGINSRYKAHAGIRLTGLPDPSWE